MTRILFLEGPIQTGKSTLIRQALGNHIEDCGGFASQRLVDVSGETVGFRIGPAASTALTAPVSGFRPGPAPVMSFADRPVLPEYLLTGPEGNVYTGVFKYFDRSGHLHTDQEIFEVLGVHYLLSSRNKPLILLDEIGGSELLSDTFRNALYDILASGIPCLGVLKQSEHARRLQRTYASHDRSEPQSGSAAFRPLPQNPGPMSRPAADTEEQAPMIPRAPGLEDPDPMIPRAPTLEERNLMLRKSILEDFGGTLLHYERTPSGDSETEKAATHELTAFVRNVFSSRERF